jgi:hypothetical protein
MALAYIRLIPAHWWPLGYRLALQNVHSRVRPGFLAARAAVALAFRVRGCICLSPFVETTIATRTGPSTQIVA